MNPLTVRIYNIPSKQVHFYFLDMCITTGHGAGTAESIFQKINATLILHNIPWINCVANGLDNTNVNIGKRNSIKSRVQKEVGHCFIVDCPCHLIHNTARRGSEALDAVAIFNVEEFCIDIYFINQRNENSFCDVTYKQIVKQVNTRWLSLKTAIRRNLDVYMTGQKVTFYQVVNLKQDFKD